MKKLDNKGMTLVEMITAMMISMIIGAAVIGILLMTLKLYTQHQVINRQYIIIDHIESVLSKELRYADPLDILEESDSTASYSSDYCYIKMYNGELYKGGSDPQVLCSDSILDGHTLSLTFEDNTNESVLYVEVCIDKGTEDEVTEFFYVESLNLELNDNAVSGDSGTILYYKLP